MKTLLLAILLLCSTFSISQTAKVAALDADEVVKVKQLHENYDAAAKAMNDYDAYIASKYKFGVVEYSLDWRFIVPKELHLNIANGCWVSPTSITPYTQFYNTDEPRLKLIN